MLFGELSDEQRAVSADRGPDRCDQSPSRALETRYQLLESISAALSERGV
jgi:hypothetical protein